MEIHLGNTWFLHWIQINSSQFLPAVSSLICECKEGVHHISSQWVVFAFHIYHTQLILSKMMQLIWGYIKGILGDVRSLVVHFSHVKWMQKSKIVLGQYVEKESQFDCCPRALEIREHGADLWRSLDFWFGKQDIKYLTTTTWIS